MASDGHPTPGRRGLRPGGDGEFDGSAELVIPNLAPGRYRTRFPLSVKVPVRVTGPTEVVVNPGKTTELTATVEPLARMSGRVIDADTGKGIPKLMVPLQTRTGEQGRGEDSGSVETDADGRFEAYGPPGQYAIVSFYTNSPLNGYAVPKQSNLGAVPPAKLDVSKPHTFPDIKLRRTTSLRAAVVDETGKPVSAPTVFTGRIHLSDETVKAGADGTFIVSELDREDVIAPRVRKGDAVNVPTPVEVGKQDGPANITVSPKNACRVRGRVTDADGKPVAGAKVVVMWHFQGLGRDAPMSTSRGVERLTTDADGRYASGALWPNDQYQVMVKHDEYARGESGQVRGVAGEIHDLGTVRLTAAGRNVRGTVVGTDGKPVAGVTVFHRDGTVQDTATTAPYGTFTLKRMFDAPGFVLARKDGYRPAYLPIRPHGEPVTVTLRKTSEPAATLPPRDAYEAALARFTRSTLQMLWNDRDQLGGYERNVFRAMARFDPKTAGQWRDEEKKRSGGKVDLTRFLDEADRESGLLAAARQDIDEALARIPATDRWQLNSVLTLGEQLLKTDKTKALRAAEEAAVRTRVLDAPERPWPLARAGDLAVRAGNAAGGKKLLAEAADLVTKLPADERNNYYRGLVAASLGPHDLPAARKLIDGFGDPHQFNRALALMVGRLAKTDPDAAERLLADFRPSNDFSSCDARLAVGFRLAAADPDRAEKVIAAMAEAKYRVVGLARLATLVAENDRPRAWRLINRAMDAIDERPDAMMGWSNYGGPAAIAGLVAVRAREVGHPDVPGLVARALAQRTARLHEGRKEREEQALSLAVVLSFADPAAARWLLAGIAPPDEYARRAPGEQRDWLFAAALADPDGAKAVAEAVWKAAKARRGGGEATSGTGLIELLGSLTGPGDRLKNLSNFARIPSIRDEPD